VLLVIAYHFGLPATGGFIGVDMFFVISGFLITNIIVREVEAGQFSLVSFWSRRIRRIWPAGLIVTAVVLCVGYLIMLPKDYRVLGADAFAQVAMLSNIRYWLGTDYFALSSEFRPLLHTWSLAVEEQFYMAMPLLLLAAAWGSVSRNPTQFRRRCVVLMAVAAAGSFAANLMFMQPSPTAVFYLAHYRAWELLCGALLATLPPCPSAAKGPWRDVIALSGLACILLPAVLYNDETAFPGFAAVLPCLGTAGLIYAGCDRATSRVTRALSVTSLQSVGIISYSLYLWHWPILAFMRYCMGPSLPSSWLLGGAAATFGLAYLTWRWVEEPFRGKARSSLPAARAITIVTMATVAVGICSVGVYLMQGLPARFSPAALRLVADSTVEDAWAFKAPRVPDDGQVFTPIGLAPGGSTVDVLFIGDSHGMAISALVDETLKDHGLRGLAALRAYSPPLLGTVVPDARNPMGQREELGRWHSALERGILVHKPRAVIACSRWSTYVARVKPRTPSRSHDGEGGSPLDAAAAAMERLAQLCDSVNARLSVLLEVPYQDVPVSTHALRLEWAQSDPDQVLLGTSIAQHRAYTEHVAEWTQLSWASRARIHDLAADCFDPTGRSVVGAQGTMFYSDDDHINTVGAYALLRQVLRDAVIESLPR
jgi:peptidoglycan/LPS O-acetylase OafA/YrhL